MYDKGEAGPLASSCFVQVSQIKDSVWITQTILFDGPFTQRSTPDRMLPGIVEIVHVPTGIVPKCFGPDGYLVGVVPGSVGCLIECNHSGLKEEFLPGVLKDLVRLEVVFFVESTFRCINELTRERVVSRA